jgi:hypothetical protein
MKIDIDKLTEAELVDLNNRIVERLRPALERRSLTAPSGGRRTPRRRRRPTRDSVAQEVMAMTLPDPARDARSGR